jgi:hypothetical protein
MLSALTSTAVVIVAPQFLIAAVLWFCCAQRRRSRQTERPPSKRRYQRASGRTSTKGLEAQASERLVSGRDDAASAKRLLPTVHAEWNDDGEMMFRI